MSDALRKHRILIIEDDPDGLRSVSEAMEDAGYTTEAASTAEAGIRLFGEQSFDAVLCDIRLPDADGTEALRRILAMNPSVPVLLMTAYGSVDSAVAAIKAGAYDYMLKPLDLADIQLKVARALEAHSLRRQVQFMSESFAGRYSAKTMIVVSPRMKALMEQVALVAGTNATVLILGESGSGKELVARALHADGKRAKSPFVAVNCGAFSETLLESELFGHEKGAFTGAVARHEGAFERADMGTLFLDEIGIAPMQVQLRLLRAIEQKEIVRVGGSRPVPVDARIISATNRDLEELAAEGVFLRDLLFRLQVVTLRVPPLRERPEDIRPLAGHFINESCREHGLEVGRVDESFYRKLESMPWPGNVRELRNAVESAVIMARAGELSARNLEFAAGRSAAVDISPGVSLGDIERHAISQALERHKGNRAAAAAELGISMRTVQRKIKEYALDF